MGMKTLNKLINENKDRKKLTIVNEITYKNEHHSLRFSVKAVINIQNGNIKDMIITPDTVLKFKIKNFTSLLHRFNEVPELYYDFINYAVADLEKEYSLVLSKNTRELEDVDLPIIGISMFEPEDITKNDKYVVINNRR